MKKYARFFALLCLTALFALSLVTLSACNDEPAPPAFVKASESADGYATVYIEDGGELDVMVLSDPQVDYTEKYKVVGSLGTEVTYSFIEDFVAATDPDLVVINGDLVMLDNPILSQVPYFVRYAEIFERLETPWTFTFGNHDCDAAYTRESATADDAKAQCSKETLIEKLSSYEHCLITNDETCTDGAGNHFVNVRERGSGKLVYTMCLFDCVYPSKTADYEPVATEAAFAPLTAALQFSPARPDADGRQPLCGDALYHYPAAVSPDSAFTADPYYGEKQGWIVWAVTEGRPGPGAAADFVAYRHALRLSPDTAAFALRPPALVGGRQVLGGVFVVPVVARVGTVEFRLCGIVAPVPGGGWTLCCPFAAEDPPAAPVGGALTPVGGKDGPATKPDKKKRKKKEKA